MTDSVYDLEICDCHHHLWDLQALNYPWLSDDAAKKSRVCGDYEAIRKKNFLIEDFRRNRGKLKVTRFVHDEAVVDRADPVAETEWLQNVADEPDSEGVPHGIVAFADFSEERVEAVLEAHCAFSNVRGIRQFVHEAYIDLENPKASLLEDPEWRKRVGLCQKFGLSFDLQIYHQQVRDAEELVKAHEGLSFAITHSLHPAREEEAYVEGWRRAIERMAAYDNVNLKLSGFGMFDRKWNAHSIRETVLFAIEAFGVERCAFASNFPVDSLAEMSYVGLWENYYEVVKDFSSDEKRRLFSDNARRIYQV